MLVTYSMIFFSGETFTDKIIRVRVFCVDANDYHYSMSFVFRENLFYQNH